MEMLFVVVGVFILALVLIVALVGAASSDGEIHGKCWVTDGDTIKVRGETVRISGVDAPELDQTAVLQNGNTVPIGRVVKAALIKKIGGRRVQVHTNGRDKFGRSIGVVKCEGEDIGQWLVQNGHAISAYGVQYKSDELAAKRMRRGMWGYRATYDPRDWRGRQDENEAT